MRQINELLVQHLSELIPKELVLPEGCLVTLIKVDTSADLKNARVWVSILPKEREQRVLDILTKKAGFLRSELGKKLFIRTIPKFHFQIDHTQAHVDRIEELIDKIHSEE